MCTEKSKQISDPYSMCVTSKRIADVEVEKRMFAHHQTVQYMYKLSVFKSEPKRKKINNTVIITLGRVYEFRFDEPSQNERAIGNNTELACSGSILSQCTC